MREIVFDTETTGFDPYCKTDNKKKDRIVEIGAIEIINFKATGNVFHKYINPEREIPEQVVKIHGIDDEKVKNCPKFIDIAQQFLDFIGTDSKLVAHNAKFDMKFINAELSWANKKEIPNERVIDTLTIARDKFPKMRNSLDALCTRYKIDNSSRTFHGALLDSELLLEVYIELMGDRQKDFNVFENLNDQNAPTSFTANGREKRNFPASKEEIQKHQQFLKKIKNPIW